METEPNRAPARQEQDEEGSGEQNMEELDCFDDGAIDWLTGYYTGKKERLKRKLAEMEARAVQDVYF